MTDIADLHAQALDATGRPEVAVPAGAGAQTRFLALLGRSG